MSSEPIHDYIPLKRLPANGVIGIFAPSSPVEESKLNRGIKYLESLGYRVETAPSCYASEAYLSGSGEMRANDLMNLLNNPKVDAVFSTRGGFGSMFMLPFLDFDKIKAARKMIVGFSDVTALQWAIWKKTGLMSISGGMVGTDMSNSPIDQQFEHYFWNLIETGKVDIPLQSFDRSTIEKIGFSLPGTVSVAAMLLGSEYFPDTSGSVLILEDVYEPRHKMEAYLQQFKLSGVYKNASAIILGEFSPALKEEYPEIPNMQTVFDRAFEGFANPVIQNFDYGHIPGKISLPVGARLSVSLGVNSSLKSRHSIFSR